MGTARQRLTAGEARRVALAAQGFDRPRPKGRVDVRHLRRVIRRIGLLQMDFVNVLLPAHYLVPFSRLGPYDRQRLHQLVYQDRELLEQWAHEASIVPADAWPLLEHRRRAHRVQPWGFEEFLEELGDRLVARVDLKADRKARRLRVRAAWVERGAAAGEVAEALGGELRTLAGWLDLDGIDVGRRGDLAGALTRVLAETARR